MNGSVLLGLTEEMTGVLGRVGEEREVRTGCVIVELDDGRILVTCSDPRAWVGQQLLREAVHAIQLAREAGEER